MGELTQAPIDFPTLSNLLEAEV
ncbi:MAG: hypothetical protein JWO77_3814, partial [Ilumatobacteraceae bacterium]|nr:hypothetical protein [Ilumatobacteraceae bacterium]